MAEQQTTQTIIPNTEPKSFALAIADYSASGAKETFSIPVPHEITAANASVMLRAGILKSTTWKNHPFATVLLGVLYADNYGLDALAGDVYIAGEGRFSTTASAKIRHAMSTGKIEGYSVDITEGPKIQLKHKGEVSYDGPELLAKVTVHVKGWTIPIIYETKLSEWYNPANPNWKSRASYMLRRNALSKALEEVAPLGVEADEAPSL